MSCLGLNYNPLIPNVWSRSRTLQPDIPYADMLMQRKVSSLSHYQNSSGLTKNQIYAKIAGGNWVSRKTAWALEVPTVCPNNVMCLPASFSNVPGGGTLCSNLTKPNITFGRRQTTSAGGSNFPDGYKFL